jgi:hypothetical protein
MMEESAKRLIDQLMEESKERVIGLLVKAGVETKLCACGEVIFFAYGTKGGKVPMTLELVNHFTNCPRGTEYRKRKGEIECQP